MKTNQNQIHPEYYAVIFSSRRTKTDGGYDETARRMLALTKQQKGFIEFESVRDEKGYGISISYWKDKSSIASWKSNIEHLSAQKKGKEKWYLNYRVCIAKVENYYEYR